MEQTIEITIEEDGTIKSEVRGVEGPGCQGFSDWLTDLGNLVEETKTRDFFKGGDQTVKTRITR